MIYAFYVLHIVISLFLILVVLLQQGKGADLSVFGGGSTMTAFGARGAATLLHKLTVWGFVAFIVTTMAIGILQGQRQGSTVMSDIEVPAATATDEDGATDSEEASEASGALADEPAVEGALADDEGDATEPATTDDGASTDAPANTDGGDADGGDSASTPEGSGQ